MASTIQHPRTVEQIVTGHATQDGAGVKLTRVLNQPLQARLDPYLLLDVFASDEAADYVTGFPPHPHRGFETITYMLTGRMRHRDSAGNEGLLETGGVQWMTAGRGVIHSEMPEQDAGYFAGFQIWLNLAAQDKMQAAAYQDIPSAAIPEYTNAQGVRVRVIAGHSAGIAGAIQRVRTAPLYLDIHLPAGAGFSQALPAEQHAFLYVISGVIEVGAEGNATAVDAQRMAILAQDARSDGVQLHARLATHLLLLAGQPLHEPIVQYGPFVMNSQAEVMQAMSDYRAGKLA